MKWLLRSQDHYFDALHELSRTRFDRTLATRTVGFRHSARPLQVIQIGPHHQRQVGRHRLFIRNLPTGTYDLFFSLHTGVKVDHQRFHGAFSRDLMMRRHTTCGRQGFTTQDSLNRHLRHVSTGVYHQVTLNKIRGVSRAVQVLHR